MIRENCKVIISDLDGTLLNQHHVISDYTRSVFQELHQQNYLIVVATGRHHLDAMPLVERLGVPLYLVTSNGARIHSPEKELLFSINMNSQTVKSILDLDIDPDITTVLFKEEVWQTNIHNEKLNSFSKEVTYHRELVNFGELEDFEAIKIFFTHENQEKLIAVRDLILEHHPGSFNHAFSLPICLEFMDKAVDKSHAIAKILEKENLDFSHAVSFGDGFNDELMLVTTGKGLIMGNAPETLKNKLSHLEVIATNHEDGVAKYLSETVLNY
ncbi:Cof-type HAD-IIB family hydrolase [Flavobacterium ammonificans]|uniref:Hydrolase n=1 Tax=Flavobacterium ammonificans TaxID=1751056 RepID=A0ABM7V2G3_9FLAO|nr:Cof-type HAD-IIB family hydrolase [Flavobacterium ammonificans]BDB53415.1 hydrolase [Flavobacterium ammonificans]